MKIATRVSVSFLAVAVVVIIVALSVTQPIVTDSLQKEIFAHLAIVAKSRASHVLSFLKGHKDMAEVLSGDNLLQSALRRHIDNNNLYSAEHVTVVHIEAITAALREAMISDEHFSQISVLNPDGKIIISTAESWIGLDRSADARFLEGRKRTCIIDAYYSEMTEKKVIDIATPILDHKDKRFLGVFLAQVELTGVYKIIGDRTGLGETGEIYLINKNGYMISPSRFMEDVFLKQEVDTINARNCLAHRGRKHIRGRKEIGVFPGYRGIKVIGTHEYLPEIHWGLLAEIDEKEALAPLSKVRALFFTLLFLIPLVTWLIGIFVSRKITQPIRKLHEGTKIIGGGNLDYRVSIDSEDEIGHFSRAFDKMTEDLKNATDKLTKEITLRKEAGEELKEEKNKLQSLVDAIEYGLTIQDRDYNIIYQNKVLSNIFGRLGEKCYRVYEGQDELCDGCPVEMAYKDGKSHNSERKVVMPSGEVAFWENTANPILNARGEIVACLEITRNITEHKQVEKVIKEYSEQLEEMVDKRTKELTEAQEQLVRREKLATLGQLAGGLGHELRNPLGAIKNAIYLLNMVVEDPEPEVKESLEIIEKEVGISERIITSLLDFARPKPPTRREVDINDVVQASLSHLSLPENVEVVKKLDKTLPIIPGDPDQLIQVFGNLALNAVQAMPDGGRLVVKSEAPSPDSLTVSFIDTGVGMDEETLRNAFEPLFTIKSKGIGLGLALTKMLVEAHGGAIDVESELGKGTTFTVNLPVGKNKQQ